MDATQTPRQEHSAPSRRPLMDWRLQLSLFMALLSGELISIPVEFVDNDPPGTATDPAEIEGVEVASI